jgi:hypothetical protein
MNERIKRLLTALMKMTLNSIDRRLSKSERALWQRQAWMMAKRIEEGRIV